MIPIPSDDRMNRMPVPMARPSMSVPPLELQERASQMAAEILKSSAPPPPIPSSASPIPPKPGEQISMGQLSSTPDYVTKFLIDLVRKTLGLTDQPQFQIPSQTQPYLVGENGPEMFTPEQPGQITPIPRQFGTPEGEIDTPQGPRIVNELGTPLPLRWPMDQPGYKPPVINRMASGVRNWAERSKTSLSDPAGWLKEQIGQFGQGWKLPELPERIPFGFGELRRKEKPGFGWEQSISGRDRPVDMEKEPIIPAPRLPTIPNLTKIPEDWRYFGTPEEGTRYKLGSENIPGDEAARQRILREIGDISHYPIPTSPMGPKTYYEAHPQERYMQMAEEANRPYREAYLRALEDARSRMQGFNLPMDPRAAKRMRGRAGEEYSRLAAGLPESMVLAAQIPAEYYKYGMEYGPESPKSQEELARAYYYRTIPETREEIAEMRKRPYFAPGGTHYWDPERGQMMPLETPKTTGTEAQQKLFQSIEDRSWTTDLMGNRIFDEEGFNDRIRNAVRYGMLPKEWESIIPKPRLKESDLRLDLKAHGMNDKQINDYIKRAKEAGKL